MVRSEAPSLPSWVIIGDHLTLSKAPVMSRKIPKMYLDLCSSHLLYARLMAVMVDFPVVNPCCSSKESRVVSAFISWITIVSRALPRPGSKLIGRYDLTCILSAFPGFGIIISRAVSQHLGKVLSLMHLLKSAVID